MLFQLQLDKPVFVRSRHHDFTWKGRKYTYNQEVPWQELNIPAEVIQLMFKTDKLYHNESLEAKHQVGDRLAEFEWAELTLLVDRVNVEVKKRTNSTQEYTKYKIKKGSGKSAQKLRGLIRTWLATEWGREIFFEKRDQMLEEKYNKVAAVEEPEAVEDTTDTEE